MLRFCIAILFLLFVQDLLGQDPYSSYKRIADKIISQAFDSSVSRSIKCYKFSVKPSDNGGISFSSYEHFKNRRGTVKEIAFDYSLYSTAIKDKFLFRVRLNSKRELLNKEELSYIPGCIKKNDTCNLLTRNEAIQIAIRDSIDFPNNLTTDFQISKKGEYYWYIQGEKLADKNKNRQSPYGNIGLNAFRYIDAKTGKVIQYQKMTN
jgi:hypothetical protein